MKITIQDTPSSGNKMSNGGSFRKPPQYGNGGRMQYMADGGMVEGPPHEQGGVAAVQEQTGEPIAEVEGGERIFSIEDTQMMEQSAAQIAQLAEQDPAGADEAAKQLGYAVVKMIMKQEQSQSQEQVVPGSGGAPAQGGDPMAQAANSFV